MSISSIQFRRNLEELRHELSQLEAQAGIVEKAAKIDEGCFIPYGIDGEGDDLPRNQQSENYFDTEFDHRRDGIRGLYFQVPDNNLRKALIEKTRLISRTLFERSIEDRAAAIHSMESAQGAFDNPKWTVPILIVLTASIWGVWKGGWNGIYIGVAGAALSYFQHQESMKTLKAKLATAKDLASSQSVDVDEWEVRPEYFSLQEELTGERDEAQDRVSAVYLRALIRNGECLEM